MTSVTVSALSRQHATPDVWSFNHRVGGGYFSDSNPDSDSEAEANVHTRVLREMDLSTRKETVEYRPNPWSIAKINAVSRATPPKPTGDKPRARVPPKAPTKQIVEAFKNQAERNARPIQHPVARGTVPLGSRGTSEGKPNQVLSCKGTGSVSWDLQTVPCNDACMRPADPLDRRGLQAGAQTHFSDAPRQRKSTHISTFSEKSVQFKHDWTLPFTFKRAPDFRPPQYPHHLYTQSSPVRPSSPAQSRAMALPGRSYIADADRDRPILHRSSPGPQSPVSGKVVLYS
ncbi:hypothetical protein BS17DRAFT_303608 [Gyrodon lividus]|nr:hypothetical protein BS17DRAFT_303608 [Gyrodon lividus]